MLDAFGLSSAALPEWLDVAVVILSLYVTPLHLTVGVAGVTISLYAIYFHSVK
jgi:hypothetical protein